jgi:hypothetical protein
MIISIYMIVIFSSDQSKCKLVELGNGGADFFCITVYLNPLAVAKCGKQQALATMHEPRGLGVPMPKFQNILTLITSPSQFQYVKMKIARLIIRLQAIFIPISIRRQKCSATPYQAVCWPYSYGICPNNDPHPADMRLLSSCMHNALS